MKPDVSCVINPLKDENGDFIDPRIDITKNNAINIKNSIEITKLSDILKHSEIYWDSDQIYETNIEQDVGIMSIYKEFEKIEENMCKARKMNTFGLKMIDIYTKLKTSYDKYIDCVYSDDNADECVFRIKMTEQAFNGIDEKDEIATIKAIEHNIVYQVLLKGYKGIRKVSLNKKNYTKYNDETNKFDTILEWVLDTDGTNLIDILANANIDTSRTISNDIREIYETLGIEASRHALYKELLAVVTEGSMNYRHMSLLIDTMTYKGQLMSIDRHGINRGDIGPLAKSSFEESTDMLINASIFAEYDKVNGVSANVMLGQQPPCGTGDSRILIDEEHMMELLKDVADTKKGKLDAIPENKEDIEEADELYTNDDLQIIINQKENKKAKCYKLPVQKVVIK